MTMISRAFSAPLGASVCLALALSGCGPVDGRDDIVELGPITRVPFAVSDFFTPSGHMGDGAKAGFITMNVGNDACKTRTGGERGKCYDFDYRPGSNLWAGAYWVFPSNNWGTRNGRRFKPWRYEVVNGVGTLTQRYNQVQFRTAASQNTFQINLTGTDSTGKVYTLRNAVFDVDGPSPQTVNGNLYISTMPGSHATLAAEPGEYTITLQDGWSLESMEMGMPVVAANAMLPANPVTVRMFNRNESASNAFEFQVGTETVRVFMVTPPVAVEYYAGSIGDTAVLRIACPEPGVRCEHRDTVTSFSADRRQLVSREWMTTSIGLRSPPPCVWNSAGEDAPFPDKNTGVVSCPAGTVTAAGDVAMCDGAFTGAINPDPTASTGTACSDAAPCPAGLECKSAQCQPAIVCCPTGEPTRAAPTDPWSCAPGTTPIPGIWQNANDIQSWIIGGFGWAMNYSEFEAQKALIVSNGGEAPRLDNLPATSIYIDDIVWNFVTTTP